LPAKIGLGGRMGIDATTKIPPETDHAWGDALESIQMQDGREALGRG